MTVRLDCHDLDCTICNVVNSFRRGIATMSVYPDRLRGVWHVYLLLPGLVTRDCDVAKKCVDIRGERMSMIFSYCNAQINLFMNMQNNIMDIETMYALLQCINICIIYYICTETTEILREERDN